MKIPFNQVLPKTAYLALKRWNYKKSHKYRFKRLQELRTIVDEEGYSYKPFDDRRAIFVHIPKCAGVSINQTIFGGLAGGHTTFEEYLSIFEPRCVNSYFKFTIVRNPWDRLVSAYFFLKKGGLSQEDRDWFNEELNSFADFDDFVKKWVNKQNIWKWHHFRPQYHYMLDKKGRIPLDFIGYFENLDQDFKYITNKIGISCDLPMNNKSKHKNYQNYYSEETKEIIRKVYSKDIRMLGYDFDSSPIRSKIV